MGYVRAIRAIASEVAASQLSFFDLNPPPQSSSQADDDATNKNNDSELSLESSMESLTLLGQEDTPLKNSVQSQVNDLNHIVLKKYLEYHSVCPLVRTGTSPNHTPASECVPPPQGTKGGGDTLACE
jgi:hypothetical protein